MRGSRSRFPILALSAVVLATGSFYAGWHLSRQPMVSADSGHYRSSKGDAQPQVRASVLLPLKAFQAGYAKRDASSISAFMQELFSRDQDIVLLGTDPGEWIEGYQQVADFIANDWRQWGEVRLNLDGAMISADHDVAWVATTGTVGPGAYQGGAIRFSAVLTRSNDRWLFRLIQFQWDQRPERLSERLRRAISLE